MVGIVMPGVLHGFRRPLPAGQQPDNTKNTILAKEIVEAGGSGKFLLDLLGRWKEWWCFVLILRHAHILSCRYLDRE